MKKNILLILLFPFVLFGCSQIKSNNIIISEEQETELLSVVNILRQVKFIGSVEVKNHKIRNDRSEVVDITLPMTIYEIANNYRIVRIAVYPEFIYFILGGFKGTTYGVVYSQMAVKQLYGFYDVQTIRQKDNYFWYIASSKLW